MVFCHVHIHHVLPFTTHPVSSVPITLKLWLLGEFLCPHFSRFHIYNYCLVISGAVTLCKRVNYIITRNKKDFKNSIIEVLSPEELYFDSITDINMPWRVNNTHCSSSSGRYHVTFTQNWNYCCPFITSQRLFLTPT